MTKEVRAGLEPGRSERSGRQGLLAIAGCDHPLLGRSFTFPDSLSKVLYSRESQAQFYLSFNTFSAWQCKQEPQSGHLKNSAPKAGQPFRLLPLKPKTKRPHTLQLCHDPYCYLLRGSIFH
jgi:hypothetical protein